MAFGHFGVEALCFRVQSLGLGMTPGSGGSGFGIKICKVREQFSQQQQHNCSLVGSEVTISITITITITISITITIRPTRNFFWITAVLAIAVQYSIRSRGTQQRATASNAGNRWSFMDSALRDQSNIRALTIGIGFWGFLNLKSPYINLCAPRKRLTLYGAFRK